MTSAARFLLPIVLLPLGCLFLTASAEPPAGVRLLDLPLVCKSSEASCEPERFYILDSAKLLLETQAAGIWLLLPGSSSFQSLASNTKDKNDFAALALSSDQNLCSVYSESERMTRIIDLETRKTVETIPIGNRWSSSCSMGEHKYCFPRSWFTQTAGAMLTEYADSSVSRYMLGENFLKERFAVQSIGPSEGIVFAGYFPEIKTDYRYIKTPLNSKNPNESPQIRLKNDADFELHAYEQFISSVAAAGSQALVIESPDLRSRASLAPGGLIRISRLDGVKPYSRSLKLPSDTMQEARKSGLDLELSYPIGKSKPLQAANTGVLSQNAELAYIAAAKHSSGCTSSLGAHRKGVIIDLQSGEVLKYVSGCQKHAVFSRNAALFACLRRVPGDAEREMDVIEALDAPPAVQARWEVLRVNLRTGASNSIPLPSNSYPPDIFVDPEGAALYTLEYLPGANKVRLKRHS